MSIHDYLSPLFEIEGICINEMVSIVLSTNSGKTYIFFLTSYQISMMPMETSRPRRTQRARELSLATTTLP